MAINNTLKDIREERNLIQADLAEAIGSCSQTIGHIEREERNPSLEIAIRLAHYLKVPVEDIFQVEDWSTTSRKPRSKIPGFPFAQKSVYSFYEVRCVFHIFFIRMAFSNTSNQFKWSECVIPFTAKFSNYTGMFFIQNLLYGFIIRTSTISTDQKYLFVVR